MTTSSDSQKSCGRSILFTAIFKTALQRNLWVTAARGGGLMCRTMVVLRLLPIKGKQLSPSPKSTLDMGDPQRPEARTAC